MPAQNHEPAQIDVELLLTSDARARLSTLQLLRLYFDPAALFKDASRGSTYMRELALAYNCRIRWILIAYLRRWGMIAAMLFLCIAPVEAVSQLPAAAVAVGCTIALLVTVCTAVGYLLLETRLPD
jgi:hypothetical protein